ncbi:MAG TPA: hypothetical protein P5127_05835 [Oscillospiraceae bacterium]|nr:hypothetical protein [Oscillospiraceae bacterium]
MNTLEKLQKQLEKDQERIDRLNAKVAEAEAAILQDPDNQKAALEAAACDKQIEAANKAKANTLQEIEAEKQREYEREVETARNMLTDIEKKANAIRDQEFAKAREFFNQYEAWFALVKQHEDLARKYDIKMSNLYSHDQGQAGMTSLKQSMDKWQAAQQSVEYWRRHHGG